MVLSSRKKSGAQRPAHRMVSLARALSKLGYTSRSRAEAIIVRGRVTVNNRTILNPSYRCDLRVDAITVDGKQLRKESFVYIAMNKPAGVVTTHSDERGRPTVYDLLGNISRWVFPVGRLDKDTTGLLILTNDNQLGERLTSPLLKVPKTYRVELNLPIQPAHIRQFEVGMILGEEKLLPAKITVKGERVIEMTIVEGKNRQVRRMCESFGYRVISLERTRIGDLNSNDLRPGDWKYLTRRAIERLLREDG